MYARACVSICKHITCMCVLRVCTYYMYIHITLIRISHWGLVLWHNRLIPQPAGISIPNGPLFHVMPRLLRFPCSSPLMAWESSRAWTQRLVPVPMWETWGRLYTAGFELWLLQFFGEWTSEWTISVILSSKLNTSYEKRISQWWIFNF